MERKFFNAKIDGNKRTITIIKPSVLPMSQQMVVNKPIHHVILMDGSGSMYPHASKVVETVKKVVSSISTDDSITLIQFRGVDDYTVHLKHATNNEKTIGYIDRLSRTGGTTCFSSPLNETLKVVSDDAQATPVMISLFTDGDPVVPWSDKEELSKMLAAVAGIQTKVDLLSVNTFGYGYGYDDSIIRQLSESKSQSMFNHLGSVEQFASVYAANYDTALNTNPQQSIDIDGEAVVRVSGKKVYFSTGSSKQYYLPGDMFFVVEKDHQTVDEESNSKQDNLTGLYALAAYYQYTGDQYTAREIMFHNIKDRYLADMIDEAFTKDERQSATEELISAVVDDKKRMVDGKTGVTHARNSQSVFALIQFLGQYNFMWMPFHPQQGKYERATKQFVAVEDKFVVDKEAQQQLKVPFSRLVWNEKRINLSVGMMVPGSVTLDKDDQDKFKVDAIPTFVHRNRMIIKDGNLNIKKLIVETTRLNEAFLLSYVEHGLTKIEPNVYEIDLTKFPIISKIDLGKQSLDGKSVYDLVLQLFLNKVEAKVLRTKIDSSAKYQRISPFADVEEKYGIDKDGSYRAEGGVSSNDLSDFYIAKDFSFTIKSTSAIPKVELKSGSKAFAQRAINEAIQTTSDMPSGVAQGRLESIEVLNKQISSKLAFVRLYMCLTKKMLSDVQLVDGEEVVIKDVDKPPMVIKTERTKQYF